MKTKKGKTKEWLVITMLIISCIGIGYSMISLVIWDKNNPVEPITAETFKTEVIVLLISVGIGLIAMITERSEFYPNKGKTNSFEPPMLPMFYGDTLTSCVVSFYDNKWNYTYFSSKGDASLAAFRAITIHKYPTKLYRKIEVYEWDENCNADSTIEPKIVIREYPIVAPY